MSERARRFLGLALLLLPVLFLFRTQGQVSERHLAEAVTAGAALLVIPGYAVLRTLRLDPLRPAADHRWPLVVPLGMAADIVLGLVLVSTPVGLSAVTLWSGLSVISLTSLGLTWKS